MKIRVEIENYDAKAKQFGEAFSRALTDAMEKAAREMEVLLKTTSPKATGAFRAAWTVRLTKGRARVPSITIANTDPGAMAIEFGRRPGKAPPPMAIAEWALSKGLIGSIPDYDDTSASNDSGGALRGDARVGRRRRSAAKERSPRRFVSKYERGKMTPGAAKATVFLISRSIARRGITGRVILRSNRTELARILRAQVVAAIKTFGLGRRVVSARGAG